MAMHEIHDDDDGEFWVSEGGKWVLWERLMAPGRYLVTILFTSPEYTLNIYLINT